MIMVEFLSYMNKVTSGSYADSILEFLFTLKNGVDTSLDKIFSFCLPITLVPEYTSHCPKNGDQGYRRGISKRGPEWRNGEFSGIWISIPGTANFEPIRLLVRKPQLDLGLWLDCCYIIAQRLNLSTRDQQVLFLCYFYYQGEATDLSGSRISASNIYI